MYLISHKVWSLSAELLLRIGSLFRIIGASSYTVL
jgi:hypothetical protein